MADLLANVRRTRRALERSERAAAAKREEWVTAVNDAAKKHSYREIADESGVQVGAIQFAVKKGANDE